MSEEYIRRDVVLDLIDVTSRYTAKGWTAVRKIKDGVNTLPPSNVVSWDFLEKFAEAHWSWPGSSDFFRQAKTAYTVFCGYEQGPVISQRREGE